MRECFTSLFYCLQHTFFAYPGFQPMGKCVRKKGVKNVQFQTALFARENLETVWFENKSTAKLLKF